MRERAEQGPSQNACSVDLLANLQRTFGWCLIIITVGFLANTKGLQESGCCRLVVSPHFTQVIFRCTGICCSEHLSVFFRECSSQIRSDSEIGQGRNGIYFYYRGFLPAGEQLANGTSTVVELYVELNLMTSAHNRLNFINRVYVHFGIAVTITSTSHSEQPLFYNFLKFVENFFTSPNSQNSQNNKCCPEWLVEDMASQIHPIYINTVAVSTDILVIGIVTTTYKR